MATTNDGYHLILTANQEIIDRTACNNNILLLGEWCKIYKKNPLLDKCSVVPFFWNKERTIEANSYLNNIREKVLDALPSILNNYHNEQNNNKFYFILLNYWLGYYIDQLYDKYKTLEFAFNSYKITSIDLLEENQYYISDHLYDFLNKTQNDENDLIHLQIYTQIISYLYPEKYKTISLSSSNINSNIFHLKYGEKQTLKKKINLFTSSILQKIFNKKSSITIVDSFLNNDQKDMLKSQQFINKFKYILHDFNHEITLEYDIDNKSRQELTLNLKDDEFEKLLSHLFFKHLPIIFFEAYKGIKKSLRSMYIPKTTYYQGLLVGHHIFDFFYAHNQNIKTLQHQHGAGYGMIMEDYRLLQEYKYSNIFLSWGWGKYILTNPKLLKNVYTPQKGKSYKLLFAYSHQGRHIHALHGSYKSHEYFTTYLNIQKEIISHLQSHYKIDILDSAYDSSTHFIERIKDKTQKFNLINKTPFSEMIFKDNYIYISSTSQTTFIETLSANIPTIILINKDIFEYSAQLENVFSKMIDVKICHDNTESLIKHLINVQENIEEWWFEESVQKIKNEFNTKFAHTQKKWIEEWISFYHTLDKEIYEL